MFFLLQDQYKRYNAIGSKHHVTKEVIIIANILLESFTVSNDNPLYFYISLTGVFNFITHVIQYNYVQTNFIYNCLLLLYYYYCTTTNLHTESETYD